MKKLLIIVAVLSMGVIAAFGGTSKSTDDSDSPKKKAVFKCFDENGICTNCNGTGLIKNPDYSKKKIVSEKYIKCPCCDGKGKRDKEETKPVDPEKYKVEVTCPKCNKKFVYKLPEDTKTKIKHIDIFAKCPYCKKKFFLFNIENPLYNP